MKGETDETKLSVEEIENFLKDWNENNSKIAEMERKFNFLKSNGNFRNRQIELEIPDDRKILNLEDVDELYAIRHNEKRK